MKVWEFPAFHWLRLHAFIAKGIVQSLVRELKSHQPLSVTKKKKKEILTCVTTWINFEGIMLNEMSQAQKNKYCIIPLILAV